MPNDGSIPILGDTTKTSWRHPSGRDITIDQIRICRTYAGILEGRPSAKDMLDGIVHNIHGRWGTRNVYIDIDVDEYDKDLLPRWYVVAWLTSLVPIHKDMMGPELVVVWFVPELRLSIPEDVARAVEHVDWDAEAQDWDP